MSTTEAGLYGKPVIEAEDHESIDEFSSQGDTRVIKNLLFSWLEEAQDPAGNTILQPREAARDTEVTVEQIGKIALQKGETQDPPAFYSQSELDAMESGGEGNPSVTASSMDVSPSEMGEYELAEWLQTGNNGGPFTINEVLGVIGDDKDLAHRMLQAENIATSGEPRQGLEKGLNAIIAS